MLSRRLAAARLGRGGRASGSSRRRSGGRCCGGAAGPAWRRQSSGRRRSTLASALEQPSARSTLRLPQRTRTRRPPARDRPQPRSCIRGKQQSRCRYRVPCNSILRRRRRRATHALLLSRELGTLAETRSAPAVDETQAFAGLTIRRRGLLLRRSRPSHLTAARSKRSGSCSSSRRQISKGLERDSIRRRAMSRSTDGRRPLHCHFLV
jgi:hypothetical protein